MRPRPCRRRALLALLALAAAGPARAGWAPDGNHLCLAPLGQTAPALASDGAGGAIAAWIDSRDEDPAEVEIAIQRITASGARPVGWKPDGNILTAWTCYKYAVTIVPDGAGGALVVWADDLCLLRQNLLALRVTADGAPALGWPPHGLVVAPSTADQTSAAVIPDGTGGGFITWEDWRSGSTMVYAQHLTGLGAAAPGWPSSGLAVCPSAGPQSLPGLATDGAGGVFVAWQDRRGGVGDIYLQRLTDAAAPASGWPAAGLPVCAAADNQGSPAIVADGAGGVFVAWSDHRAGTYDIYAARVTASGELAPGWLVDGTPVCVAADDQRKPQLVTDGAGGMIVGWQDHRASSWDLYAQRLGGDAAVAAGWAADGMPLCVAAGDQLGLQLVAGAAQGVIATWQDARSGSNHIYAQRLDASGTPAPGWPVDGAAVCAADGIQLAPRIVTDGAGGAIVAWTDQRSANASAPDVYAQRLLDSGPIPTGATGLTAACRDGQTFLTWTCPPDTAWTYRVYASASPITQPGDLGPATLLATLGDSTWYDRRLSVLTGVTHAYRPDSGAAPLGADRGLFVATPGAAGARYFAVTAQLAGYPENHAVTPGVNTLGAPVFEQLDAPRPVWQGVVMVNGTIPANIYTLWTGDHDTPAFPAMANLPGITYDCAVVRGGVAPNNALYVSLHVRQGNVLQCVYGTGAAPGEWVLGLDDPLNTEDGGTFWYGYHQGYITTEPLNPVPGSGTVIDYTLRRVAHTLRWARRNFAVDTTRVYAFGFSMAAVGDLLLALRHPDLIAAVLAVVGKVDFSFLGEPNPAALFNPGNGLRVVADRLWGPVAEDLPASEGGAIYDQLNASKAVAALGAVAMSPLMTLDGRNDAALGWAEKVPFYRAMREARQGGTFFWDQRDHLGSGSAAWTPMTQPSWLYRFRTDRSFPALSRCSADGDPGDGGAAGGDSVGTINGYVEWDTSFVDQPARWQVGLHTRDLTMRWGPAPGPDSATADVTPRRLQSFAVHPDSAYAWSVKRVADGAVVQQGTVVGDSLGLVTVPGVKIYRGGSLLRLSIPGTDWDAVTGVSDRPRPPARLALALAPNPARGDATLSVRCPGGGEARVELFDPGGRRVREVYRGPGTGTLTLRLDQRGLAGGLYFVVATQGGQRSIRRLVVLR